MAKEVDLKKIELKVSINCCEGCKRKVKKQLQGIEGVLQIEIDYSQPKVTLLGSNVEPKILVKKLHRIGKQVEILSVSSGTPKAEKDKMGTDVKEVGDQNEKPKAVDGDGLKKSECPEKEKCVISNETKETKPRDKKGSEKGIKKQDIQKEKDKKNSEVEVTKTVIPSVLNQTTDNPGEVDYTHMKAGMVQYETNITQMQYPVVTMAPCYAPGSASYAATPMYYAGPYQYMYQPATPMLLVQSQPPVTRAGDYFSDENAMGCSVM